MKRFSYLMILLLSINLASAAIVSFSFDKSVGDSIQEKNNIYYSSSLIFEVTTPTNQLCRYSSQGSSDYNGMNAFEDNFNTIHRLELGSLSDGIHTYYIRCRDSDDINDPTDGLTHLKATFKTSAPIAAQISMEDSPLTAGKYEINLVTTKIPSTTPSLTFSYDGIVYNPIVLNGGSKNWKGYLIISDSPEERVGSFKFEARDLESRIGTEIFGTKVFLTDTRPPAAINTISAVGEYGEINLEWYLDEEEDDIDRINIYRSENPNVDLTDFYKDIDGDRDYYNDVDVDNGQTYYYRIAPEDDAGNIASLSREVKATALRTASSTTTSTGLDPEFYGKVDSVLVEIDLLQSEINLAKNSINSVGDEEQRKTIGIQDEIQSAESELSAVRKAVENLKSQDLSEAILDSRLSSNQVKLNILRKKAPESFSLLDSSTLSPEITEDNIRTAILEKAQGLSNSLIDKSVKRSKEIIEENGIKIRSEIKVFEITYLDGSRTKKTLIEHYIDSTGTSSEGELILRLPSGPLNSESIDLQNSAYTPESEDTISFAQDTKKITYTTDDALSTSVIDSIQLSPIVILEESTELTGYFLSNISATSSFAAAFLIIIIGGLIFYLFYMKKAQAVPQPQVSEFLEKAKEVKRLHKEGKHEEYNELYKSLQNDYINLPEPEKKKIFKEVKHMLK